MNKIIIIGAIVVNGVIGLSASAGFAMTGPDEAPTTEPTSAVIAIAAPVTTTPAIAPVVVTTTTSKPIADPVTTEATKAIKATKAPAVTTTIEPSSPTAGGHYGCHGNQPNDGTNDGSCENSHLGCDGQPTNKTITTCAPDTGTDQNGNLKSGHYDGGPSALYRGLDGKCVEMAQSTAAANPGFTLDASCATEK